MKLKTISESIVSKIPSLQDLVSAIRLFQIGKSSVIYPSGGGYVVIRPIKGKNISVDTNKYNEIVKTAVANDNYSLVVDGLKEMGFEISGKIDQTKVGKTTDTKLEQEVERTGARIPRSGKREIGGLNATKLNNTQTQDYIEGKPDSVEIEVEYNPEDTEENGFVFHTHPEEPKGGYDPNEALRNTDKTGTKNTHPKMADNNYFPGKMQKR
jgi:hypothetical protein